MTASNPFVSKAITQFLSFFLIFFASLSVTSCNSSDSQTTENGAQNVDSGGHAAEAQAPQIPIPEFNILYATQAQMREIVGRLGGSGKKIVFQDIYTSEGLSLAAFTGKPGHKFDSTKDFAILKKVIPYPITLKNEILILGDLEISGQGNSNADFNLLKEKAEGNQPVIFFFTPIVSYHGGAARNHLIYGLSYTHNLTNFTDSSVSTWYENNKNLDHFAALNPLNPVPPRDAH